MELWYFLKEMRFFTRLVIFLRSRAFLLPSTAFKRPVTDVSSYSKAIVISSTIEDSSIYSSNFTFIKSVQMCVSNALKIRPIASPMGEYISKFNFGSS